MDTMKLLEVIYTMATNVAFNKQQVVGRKKDYYVTLAQLENILRRVDEQISK